MAPEIRCEVCVISFFSGPLRRQSRCEICVSSLFFSAPRRRRSRFDNKCHLFSLGLLAPAQPLRSVSVVSLFLAPVRWHSRFDV